MVSADEYIYNDKKYNIEIVRKNNKNTYLRVRDNKIIVSTNYFTTKKQIIKLIEDNTAFINKALDKSIKKKEDDHFKLFGKSYDIIYGPFNTEINNDKIYTKDEKAFNKYLSTRNLEVPKSDEYITGIYLKRQVNVVKYDTTDVDENQRVDYRVAKQEESKIKNQILCNK